MTASCFQLEAAAYEGGFNLTLSSLDLAAKLDWTNLTSALDALVRKLQGARDLDVETALHTLQQALDRGSLLNEILNKYVKPDPGEGARLSDPTCWTNGNFLSKLVNVLSMCTAQDSEQ